MKAAIVEYKVREVILIINDNSLLAGLKAESLAKLQQKGLNVVNQSFLQVTL